MPVPPVSRRPILFRMDENLPGRTITFDLEPWDGYAFLVNALSSYATSLQREVDEKHLAGRDDAAKSIAAVLETGQSMLAAVISARGADPDNLNNQHPSLEPPRN